MGYLEEVKRVIEEILRETTQEERDEFFRDLSALDDPDDDIVKKLNDLFKPVMEVIHRHSMTTQKDEHGEGERDADADEDDEMEVDEQENGEESGVRTIYAGKIVGQDEHTYDEYFERKPFTGSFSGYWLCWSCDRLGTAFPKDFIVSNIINLVTYRSGLSSEWAEYLEEDKKTWKRGQGSTGRRARQAYLCNVWGEQFGPDKEEETKARELLESMSTVEDNVRNLVHRLSDLASLCNSQVIKCCQLITGVKCCTALRQPNPPRKWDFVRYEEDIHFERFLFDLIRNDIRNAALYKFIAALEAALTPLFKGYSAGMRWVEQCDFMKPEEILELHRAGSRHLHLQQQRTDFFQPLEEMLLKMDEAYNAFSSKLEVLESDPGNTQRKLVYSEDILHELFGEILVSGDGDWREQDINVIHSKFLPIYQTVFESAMNEVALWRPRLRDAREEIKSVIERLSGSNAHKKKKEPNASDSRLRGSVPFVQHP